MEAILGYDSWKLADGYGREKVIGACEHCGEDILAGEAHLQLLGDEQVKFCDEQCAEKYVRENPELVEEVLEDGIAEHICYHCEKEVVNGYSTADEDYCSIRCAEHHAKEHPSYFISLLFQEAEE